MEDDHPNEKVLREFALGRLHESELIEAHVSKCEECARQIDLITSRAEDSFLSNLKRTGAAEESHRSVIDILGDTIGVVRRISLPEADGHETPVSTTGGSHVTFPGQLGKFRIAGEIARGGVGAVLRARDEDLGRDVALKVLLDDHDENHSITERFVEEAQIGGQLQHPGIVPIHEMGVLGGKKPYIAMKLVKGTTLSRLLDVRDDLVSQRPHFLSIFQQICQPMAYAHSKGVVHRDLKPSNVMVGSFGEVQVMDWGLAKVLARGGVNDDQLATRHPAQSYVATIRSGSGSESLTGSVIGTPAYMAPEQAQGRIEDTDERSDVFGLGAILCEMLTGDPPYRGASAQEIYHQAKNGYLDEAVARLDQCGADETVIELAKHCLAFEARRRPRDAGEVLSAISTYLDSLESQARIAQIDAAKEAARAEAEVKSRRRTFVLAAALLMAVLVGGNGYWSWRMTYRETVDRARSQFGQSLIRAETFLEEQAMSKAEEALAVAEDLISDELLPEDTQQLRALQRNHAFLQSVEEIQQETDLGALDAKYGYAFRELLGEDALALPVQEGHTLIRESVASDRVEALIATALDEWAFVRWRNGQVWKSLTQLSKAVDPNKSWRVRLWDELEKEDAKLPIELLAYGDDVPTSFLCLIANSFAEAQQHNEAEAMLRKALRKEPGHFRANFNLGGLLVELPKRKEEGLRYLVSAHALRPDDFRTTIWLLYNSRSAKAYQCYTDVFTHALALHSGDRESLFDWGSGLWNGLRPSHVNVTTESLDAWITELKRHFDFQNPNSLLCAALGQAIGHRFGDDEAEEALKWPQLAAERTLRTNADVLSMLARVHHHVGQSAEAVRVMEEAMALGGGSRRDLLAYRTSLAHPASYDSLDAAIEEETVVPLGASWKYFKGTESPGPKWASDDFDDQAWDVGPSGFGYGYDDGVQQTELDDMQHGYTTLYLRKRFSVLHDDSVAKATLSLRVDGGFIVFLNGQQLMTRNLDGDSAHDALAKGRSTHWTQVDLSSALRVGENCIAIFSASRYLGQGSFSIAPTLSLQYRPESHGFLSHIQSLQRHEVQKHFSLYVEARRAQLLGQDEKAEQLFRSVIQLDPSHITPYRHLFECLEEVHGTSRAVTELRDLMTAPSPRGYLPEAHQDVNVETRFDGKAFHFVASPLISADPRTKHVKTRWEICEGGKEFRRENTFDWLTATPLETLRLPGNRLQPNKTYRCRVSYVLAQGTYEVQAEATIPSEQYQQELVRLDLGPLFNADVISNPGDELQDSVDGDEYAFAALTANDPLFERTEIGVHRIGDHNVYNAIQVTERDTAPLRIPLKKAVQLDALRVLMTSGWEEAELPIRLEYDDGTSEETVVNCEDWTDAPTDGPFRAPNFFTQDFVPILTGLDGIKPNGDRRRGLSIFEANIQPNSQKKLAAVILEAAGMKGYSPRSEFPSRVNIFAVTGVCSSED